MTSWYHDGVGWGGWLVMTLVMVAFWGLVIWGLVTVFRSGGRDPGAMAAGRRDPMEILDERFARGEIDAEEYHARQDVLRTSIF